MQVNGIVFVGSRTTQRAPMAAFVRDVLQLTAAPDDSFDADVFSLPDGSLFAVTQPAGMDPDQRTIGFLVDDVAAAAAELQAAGVATDEISTSMTQRYLHFRAPDGQLYELVENL